MRPSLKPVFGGFTSAWLLLLVGTVTASAADWTFWRGPRFDGTADASGLPDTWDSKGGADSNVLWVREDIGGPCTPIVMSGKLYTIQRAEPGTAREGEKVVCLDAATGETLWENRYNVWMSDVPAERIGWSSVVGDPETGYVYALGACDVFLCINGETGETVWSRPLHEEFGMLSTYGGRTNFPVIHEDLVIISGIIINWGEAARPNHRILGFDKRTGDVVWFSGTKDLPDDTTYSAPSLVTIDGQRQLILGTGDGAIWGFQPRTGKPLWNYDLSMRGIYATPLVVGDTVFATHSEENVPPYANLMGAVVALKVSGTGDDTKVEELWKQMEVVVGYSEPVHIDGRLYVVDDRCKMWIFDAESGDAIVEQESIVGSRQRAALLYADGKIYVLSENGRWAVAVPTEEGFEVVSKGAVRDAEFAGSPIVADGRLYFPSTTALYCVASEGAVQKPETMSELLGTETPIAENPELVQVQILPAETILKPGQSMKLRVNLFNRLGQKLSDSAPVVYSVEGPGSIDGSTYTAPAELIHSGAVIKASVGNVVGTTRVRIVPGLPWKFTFDGLQDPPLPWVGARYRNVIREIDGSPALVKITTIPKGARSSAWMGPSNLQEYTISADARGARMSDQLPDIGLTNHGYGLELMGESQLLQITTWHAQNRLALGNDASAIEFPWKEDVWYRMKFRVDIESEPPAAVALLRGKVWPRDEAEPKEWTITARDESPNLHASPGLFGNAKVAELYLDNIEVTANTDEP